MDRASLPLREWFLVAAISSTLLTLGFLSCYSAAPSLDYLHTIVPISLTNPIEVSITGAVENPGIYSLQKGATMADLFEKAVPLSNADLQKFKLEAKLRNHRQIVVPFQKFITIYLEGEVVRSGPFSIKLGTYLNELINSGLLTPEAEAASLNKKRKLKEGDVIVVKNKFKMCSSPDLKPAI